MKKRRQLHHQKAHEKPIAWLPVDSRLFSPFLSFQHVHGLARAFLVTEMVLSVGVAIGSVLLLVIGLVPK